MTNADDAPADADDRPRARARALDELYELQRLQRWLEPIAIASVLVEALALAAVFRTDEGYGTAILTAGISSLLLVWAHRERARSTRLEAELGAWLG